RPAFRQHEIDSERNVVLEEINMNEDDPTDVAHEQFVTALWANHPLAPPILGNKESITTMSRDTIHDYWARRYSPRSTVVSIAGHLPDDIVDRVAETFGSWEGATTTRALTPPPTLATVQVRRRDTEQAHLVFGSPSFPRDDDRRFALMLADHVLGGGMSSRLFHEIREERGLAYAVHSFRMPFADAGASAIYVGTTPTQAAEVLELVRSEVDKLLDRGLTDDELERAKGHVKGALALGLEDAQSRMTRLGRTELTGLDHMTVDETVERIARIDHQELIAAAKAAYSGPYVIGAVGPFDRDDLLEHVQ
ncbi:MAG: insulinase family protein, partial [Acidimicrobiia bacterium]|nr:insulinase family protein [Acidimicrobiia bacterium]